MRYLLPLLLLLPPGANAQVYQPVFPDLSGDALRTAVANAYRPDAVLDWANARDTLFARVLALDDDSLRCLYSGHTLYLDPAADPTQYVYLNGITLGMNTEHAYPQSKGAADGNARSDMHHLFPTRIPVNEARGDLPFLDVPDAQTDRWFRSTQIVFTPPAQNRDLWSEVNDATAFEPRESVKGDVARAVFYFYTMYKGQADAADPAFFSQQRTTLCNWHLTDPADSAELIKTWRIAPYQDGKPNPYVLDCTAALRAFCPEIPPVCLNSSTEAPPETFWAMGVSPLPFDREGTLTLDLPENADVALQWWTALGQALHAERLVHVQAGTSAWPLRLPNRPSGLLFLEVVVEKAGRKTRRVVAVP